MKKIGVIQLGLSAAGTFLGAGFISGQEIWSFFGCFGAAGIPGFVVNALICGIIFYIAVDLVRKTGVEEVGLLMTPGNGRFFAGAVDFLQFLMLYGIGVIMTAGVSALLHELTGIDREVILRIRLWELELQDRQYLTPENYIDFMADDLADELEYPRSLIYQVLTTEEEILDAVSLD